MSTLTDLTDERKAIEYLWAALVQYYGDESNVPTIYTNKVQGLFTANNLAIKAYLDAL